MGVIISTTSTLAPVSLASSIIGFVSFAFTVATFLKIVWSNLETMSEPAHDVHTYLNTLREEILEERASIRLLKRTCKNWKKGNKRLSQNMQDLIAVDLDDVTIKTMQDNVRHLIRQFEQIEKPFLKNNENGIQQAKQREASRRRHDRSPSPYYEHSAYASPPEREKRSRSEDRKQHDADLFWTQRVKYAPYNLKRRMVWLYSKSTATQLFATLSRLQTRRIARQVNYATAIVRETAPHAGETHAQLNRIEERLNRVVGVRRIE